MAYCAVVRHDALEIEKNMGNNTNEEFQPSNESDAWDHKTHEEFLEYYASASASDEAYLRMGNIRDMMLRVIRKNGALTPPLDVADIGCNAGTLSMIWAEQGHRVFGLDVSAELINIADKRAQEAGLKIDYRVGSATDLPWPDVSMDVCLAPELLEHVQDWERCLDEFTRILKPGGILFITTSNKLCPKQQEFNLTLYSWYPGFLKRYYEKLSVTTRRDLANYATYPAVNWFTFYGLRKALKSRGCTSMDRFDVMDTENGSMMKKLAVAVISRFSIVRWFAHVCTPYTIIVAAKVVKSN